MFKKFLLFVFSIHLLNAYQVREVPVPMAIPASLSNDESVVYGFKQNSTGVIEGLFFWHPYDKEATFYPLPKEFFDKGNVFKQKKVLFDSKVVNKHGEYLWSPMLGAKKLGDRQEIKMDSALDIISINDKGNILLLENSSFTFWNGKTFRPLAMNTTSMERLFYSHQWTLNNHGEIVFSTFSFSPSGKQVNQAIIADIDVRRNKDSIDMHGDMWPIFVNDQHQIIGRFENSESFFVIEPPENKIQVLENFTPISYNNKGTILGVTIEKEFGVWKNGKISLIRDSLKPSNTSIIEVYSINDHEEILGRDDRGNLLLLTK